MSISQLFDGYNAGYVQDLFESFSRNPQSVPAEWRAIFERNLPELMEEGLLVPDGHRRAGRLDFQAPSRAEVPAAPSSNGVHTDAPSSSPAPSADPRLRLLPLIARATALVQAFRDHGHQLAQVDPLGSEPPGHPQLDPTFFGTSLEELAEVPASLIMEGGGSEPITDTLRRLRAIYCGSIGYQFEHLEDPHRVRWLWNQVESGAHTRELSADEKIHLLRRLSQVEGFERFLHKTYLGAKRFSIEGNDVMVPMLDTALEEAARQGGSLGVIGMAHRGRLNVLTHTVGTPHKALIREFEGALQLEPGMATPGTGDVKYHLGAEGTLTFPSGRSIRVRLAPNPSHLEFVNPVVQGMARALQWEGSEASAAKDSAAVVPILIHGDAAFAAEGVVAEALNLARLRGYSVGGVIHIIANNQVGFTTDPHDGRSTRYASDVAKGYDIPVVHVNADDPEACLSAVRLAMAYRAEYGDDFVIDLVGYRRHGHNEGDEPTYTQPKLYQRVQQHPTVRELFAGRLASEGTLDAAGAATLEQEVLDYLRELQADVKAEKESPEPLKPPIVPVSEPRVGQSAVPFETLEEVNRRAVAVPDGFQIHPKLRKQFSRRVEDFSPATALDWAHAESLAFGTLVREGIPVRLSGQDCERGTFSHRHLVLHDPDSGVRVLPLAEIGGARFEVFNSPLSESAVLGFEYGYSVAAQNDFVLWEGQFGDFVNVAQPILDQFIASGWSKWNQIANLTLLLPHGYEGQGPEHSSARLERFLQLCAEDNLRVAYPTTPAQYFHLLRRQALSVPKRPLIVMSPKSLLRHPKATSPVSALSEGGFLPVLPDPLALGRESQITRLLLCSGKVYYDLLGAEGREAMTHVAVARVEELYPFPSEAIEALVQSLPALKEVFWVQEEPGNMGAVTYVGPRLRKVIPREIPIRPVSRPDRASPAEGRAKAHEIQQAQILAEALGTTGSEG